MSSRQLEEKQEEESNKKLAEILGIEYDDLIQLDWEVYTNESKDGLIYSHLLQFNEDSPKNILDKIEGLDQDYTIHLEPGIFEEPYEDYENNLILTNKDIKFRQKLKTPPALNVNKIAAVFAEYIPKLTQDSGMMVGIFGSWGRGKTYLFHKILFSLENNADSIKYVPVEFSAWKYRSIDSTWAYLYKTLEKSYFAEESENSTSVVNKFKKIFLLNKEKYGLFPIISFVLIMLVWSIFSLLVDKDFLIRIIISSVGLITAIKIAFLFMKYKNPVASIFKQYFNIDNNITAVLGIQHEIQNQIKILLHTWIKTKDKKIVLFIDDIDRCNIDQVSETLDGLRLILDDPDIYSKLIIIVAADDNIIKSSVELKYEVYKDDTDLYKQYLEKIFIFGIKLNPLSSEECVEILDAFSNHHFFIKHNPFEGLEDVESIGDIFDDKDSKKNVEYTDNHAIFSIDNVEDQILKDSVQKIDKATPRRIKIFLYKYALFIRLYTAISSKVIEHETVEIIIDKLLNNELEVEDILIEKISGLLSAF